MQKGRSRRRMVETRGLTISYGEYGLQAVTGAWITARQIEAVRKTIAHAMKREGRIWIRIFPDKPIIDTEFGYWSSENGSTEAEQVNVFNQTFTAFKYHTPYDASGIENPSGNLCGTTWWCIFDWYQNKAKKNGWQTMGLITMDRKTEKQVALALRNAYLPFSTKDGIFVSVKESDNIPNEFQLEQNYPNPFNPSTTIQFNVITKGDYSLKVYDILGREITTLFSGELLPGKHSFNFVGDKFSSGVYCYRLSSDKLYKTKKMVLIK